MNEEQYRHEHTLDPPTDPREVNHPDAYKQDQTGVQIDPTKVVLVKQMRSCIIPASDGEIGIAFQFKGRVNQTDDEVAVTHVASITAVAKIVAQLIELAVSVGEESATAFHKAMSEEMDLQVGNHMAYINAQDEEDENDGS